jgi:hypothetical protein
MNIEMQIIREVNIQAEGFYDDAIEFGRHAAYALRKEHRSQITGLENIANSALKVADILDYIKRQTARSKESQQWRQGFPEAGNPQEAFGQRLLNYLEEELAPKHNVIANRLNIGNQTEKDRGWRRSIYLHLIRQFVRQMAVQYEYCVIFGTEKKGA